MILETLPLREIIVSLVLVALLVLIQTLVFLNIRKQEQFISINKRRLLSSVKNGVLLFIIIGLVLIWAPTLRTFVFSLAAFTVAIVIATKELILCLSGGVLRILSGPFRVGNWININGIHGQVLEQNFLTTKVQEVHSNDRSYEFTGRTITIPNSLFLAHPVKNENFFNQFVYHSFSITMETDCDYHAIEEIILKTLNEHMEDYKERAQRYNKVIEDKAGLDMQDIEPQVVLETTAEARIRMNVTAFMPTNQAMQIEQATIRAALDEVRNQTLQKIDKK